MTVTNVPLCQWKDTQGRRCPAASDPFSHVCWHCGIAEVEHSHIGDRGMGGSKAEIAISLLCHAAHEQITLSRWTEGINEVFGRRYWRLWDLNNNTIAERELTSGGKTPGVTLSAVQGLDSERYQSVLSPEANSRVARTNDDITRDVVFSAWEREVRSIALVGKSLGFLLGDKIVYGEDAFGESRVWAVLDELGMAFETLANMASVCRAFPPDSRRDEVSFAVHQALAPTQRTDPEKAAELLDRVVDEGLSSRAVRAIVGPPRVVVKRWTLDELRLALAVFQCRALRNNGRQFTEAFLEALGVAP